VVVEDEEDGEGFKTGEEIAVQRSNHYTNLYILVGFL
jgi:hypothetical protein